MCFVVKIHSAAFSEKVSNRTCSLHVLQEQDGTGTIPDQERKQSSQQDPLCSAVSSHPNQLQQHRGGGGGGGEEVPHCRYESERGREAGGDALLQLKHFARAKVARALSQEKRRKRPEGGEKSPRNRRFVLLTALFPLHSYLFMYIYLYISIYVYRYKRQEII